MATIDGSFITMPSPRTYTRVFAVPRSMARSLEKSPARTLSSMVVLSRVAASVDGHSLLRLVHSSISVWEQTRTPGAPQTEAQIGQPILAGIKFFTYLHFGYAIHHCIIKRRREAAWERGARWQGRTVATWARF